MSIDWSKAPEGAEYARKTTAGVDWYKRDALGIWVYMAKNGEWIAAMWTSEKDCEQRPEWTGEGLPPVGVVCEYLGAHQYDQWSKVNIFAQWKDLVFVDFGDGWRQERDHSRFRPIRTPEQIASEEREAKAKAMYLSIYFAETSEAWLRQPEATRETFRKAIDAGWQQVKS